MKTVIKTVSVGNEAQNADCVVTLSPGENGIEFSLSSLVQTQYGAAIRATVLDELKKHGVENCKIDVVDRGALDCVIRARVETAVKRGVN